MSMRPALPSEGMDAFAEQVSLYTASRFNITTPLDLVDSTYSVALHDAIMLYAHAATGVIANGGNLRDGKTVTETVRGTSFKGVGDCLVSLDKHGDQIESYEVLNYVAGKADGMVSVPVGVYNNTAQQYTPYAQALVWP